MTYNKVEKPQSKLIWRPTESFEFYKYEDFVNSDFVRSDKLVHHEIDSYLLAVITEGTGYHSINFKDYPCMRGSVITVRKGDLHRFSTSSSIRGFLLFFNQEFLEAHLHSIHLKRLLILFNELVYPPRLNYAEYDLIEFLQTIKALRTEVGGHQDSFNDDLIRNYLEILLNRIARQKHVHKAGTIIRPKYIQDFLQIQDLVENHDYTENNVHHFADLLGVSSKTINNITSSVVHMPAKKYIDTVLSNRIKKYLVNTDLKMKEISEYLNFDNLSNFYKYFKNQTDMNPGDFRKEHTKGF